MLGDATLSTQRGREGGAADSRISRHATLARAARSPHDQSPRGAASIHGFVMRASTFAVVLAALAVGTTALSAIDALANLDRTLDVPLEPLARGDLRVLLAAPSFLERFPSVPNPRSCLAPSCGLLVLAMCGALLLVSRRWRRCPAAALALLSGAVPYAIGALALADNVVPSEAGRWLVWMVHGPLYAAVASLVFAARELLLGRCAEIRCYSPRAAATAS
jgi:hypothetical protein